MLYYRALIMATSDRELYRRAKWEAVTEPGLSSRSRQRSQRSGMLVGVTMALTIIVCLFAFMWIYATIGPLLSDFIPGQPIATATPSASESEAPAGSEGESAAPAAASTSSAPQASGAAEWKPTHIIADGDDINFRADATTDSNSVAVLAPGTPLKSLGEEQEAEGATWMHFQTENGTEGWVRSIDVIESNA